MRGKSARYVAFRVALGALLVLAPSPPFSLLNPINSLHRQPEGPVQIASICQVQGKGFHSPYEGQTVQTQGVVFADLDGTSKRGFFLQMENCDGDPVTSDGIFVYLGVRQEVVQPGDRVEVTGQVQEYYGMTEITASPTGVNLISQSNPLPSPVDLSPPLDNHAATEYFETLEGMSVRLASSTAVGPTDDADQTWVVDASLGLERVFQDDPAGTGEILCVDDAGLFEIAPEAKVGDHITGLAGALEYTGSVYCLQLVRPPSLLPALTASSEPPIDNRSTPPPTAVAGRLPAVVHPSFSIASFNLADLFDTTDDPTKEDTVLSASEYQRRLQKRALAIHDGLGEPEILAVQEVENLAVLQALVSRPEILEDYEIIWVEGPDERGIDIALLVRPDRVRLLEYRVEQGCTGRVDGFGPDGNRDVANPQNAVTCDTNGDGVLDGNRLFSRPPLVVHLKVCRSSCLAGEEGAAGLWLIANHWKSKVEDSNTVPYTQPRRIEEAQFVTHLAQEILRSGGENLILLGDLNDFPGSPPLALLSEQGLHNLWAGEVPSGRYSYNYQGLSQVLDYILANLKLPLAVESFHAVPINADYPAIFEGVDASFYRSSDHDPLLARIAWLEDLVYLPTVTMR